MTLYTRPTFDVGDEAIRDARAKARSALDRPLVGDWVRMPDGAMLRFTHDWGDGLQTTAPKFGLGSFYLAHGGGASYSGALDPTVPLATIHPTADTKPGAFWFFHHDDMRAHNGVHCEIACRVWKVQP